MKIKELRIYLFALFGLCACDPQSDNPVSNYAGQISQGFSNGLQANASFYNPAGVASNEGDIYVADSHNHAIRKIDREGIVTTLAGTGSPGYVDGNVSIAQFFFPTAVAVDDQGNVYVADSRNQLIRKITPEKIVVTIARSNRPLFQNPEGIAVDGKGNVFVSDHTDRIYRIDTTGAVSVYAGCGVPGWKDGVAKEARFYLPRGLVLDSLGNLYVADSFNNRIRMVDPNGNVSTLAGSSKKGRKDGIGDSSLFFHPAGITFHKGQLIVADLGNQLIRKIDAKRRVTTYAGSGIRGATNGTLLQSSFWNPIGVASHSDNVIVADNLNNLIRQIKEK